MDLQGRIKLISPIQQFGTNGFQKREIVITTEEQYPQHVVFEFTQDKCSLLDAFQPGQLVRISFNVRGREWINPQGEAKYFNSLQGWRIENMEMAQQYPPQGQPYQQEPYQQSYGGQPYAQAPQQMPPAQTNVNQQEAIDDDLPF